MKKLLAGLLTLWCAAANAQSVQQSGNITPGHAACWAITGAIFDCGAPGGGVSVVGSTTTNDFAAFNASGSLIDSGINPTSTSSWSGLQNFNGGATAPTRPSGDNSTNVATTAFVNGTFTGQVNNWTALQNFNGGATAPTRVFGDNTTNVATTAFVQGIAGGVAPDAYGTVDRTGATDMGALINTTLAASANCGGSSYATVYLRAGTYLITTPIVPRACVTLRGDGSGKTVLLSNTTIPILQTSGTQVVHFQLLGVTIKDNGGHASGTALSFTAIQDTLIEDIEFAGYTSGTLLSIAGATVTTFSDTNGIWNSSNSFQNVYRHWISRDGCSVCIMTAGAYGSTTTSTPANSSNVPSIVSTLDLWDDILIYGVALKGFDFIKATDTHFVRKATLYLNNASAIPLVIGDDNANFPGNNYVNSMNIQYVLAMIGTVCTGGSPCPIVRFGDWTFNNKIEINTDIAPASLSQPTAQANVTMAKVEVCGENFISTFSDGSGFNTNRLCLSKNFGSSDDGQGTYVLVPNGSATRPIWSFAADANNGIYFPEAGFFGFSKGVEVGSVAQSVSGSVKLNGATSGSCTIGVAATAGTATFCGVTTIDTSGNIGSANSITATAILSGIDKTLTGTTGSVTATTTIFNPSGSFTATLPAASSQNGRILYMKTVANQTVASATSNIVPLVGGAASTGILAGTAGKWAILVSDGTNWNITAAN